MVRYIKDGAYTIVVDDASPTGSRDESRRSSRSGPRSKAPSPSHRGEKLKAIQEAKDNDETNSHASNDGIDYADTSFILQNLSIVTPKYETDKTFIMLGRRDMAEQIAHQVCFYVYCMLLAYVNKPVLPSILMFGDGYIGSRIITQLTECECHSFLRIFCRGDVAAEEWIMRGYQASSDLTKLLGGAKPNIIILAADYYSFHQVFHLLTQDHLVTQQTAVISATLGFQRKKLFFNFSTPTIFRTFVEPDEIVKGYRTRQMKKTNFNFVADLLDTNTLGSPKMSRSRSLSNDVLDNISLQASLSPLVVADDNASAATSYLDNTDASELTDPHRTLNNIEKAATILADRTLDLHYLLTIIENYYSLHRRAPDEARFMALKALVGYVDGRFKTSMASYVTKDKKEARRIRQNIEVIEKAVLHLFDTSAIFFQKEFSRRLPIQELNRLTNEYFKLALTLPSFIKQPHSPVSPASSAHSGNSQASNRSHRRTLHHQATTPSKASEPKTHDEVNDEADDTPIHPMHESSQIYEIFLLDEDYSQCKGPAFEYMAKLDAGDKRKTVFHGATDNNLKILTGQSSVHSHLSGSGSPHSIPSTPMYFRKDHHSAPKATPKIEENRK